jgi:hypothetical protein
MTKWPGQLKKLTRRQHGVPSSDAADVHTNGELSNEGRKYLDRVRGKMTKLVDDFSNGRVNRAQFEELYAHYQKERKAVETLITSQPSSDAWRMAVTEGQSINIRRRLAARVLGYAVFVLETETPLRVYGEFATLHDRWISPMLAKVRRETKTLYQVGTFETGGDEAVCLSAVPGRFTTLLVLYSNEPARVQIQSMEDLHRHFEQANHRILARWNHPGTQVEPSALVFPYAAAFE